ncbi:protein of unknown function [Shinella sp. WSC3-e]|nr:hypothetical protein SHINE37_41474 [Rhizobiaceae bacterium]CAK7256098.1 protein of unknown function [Shinella sp. WSC3-e]
MAPTFGQAGRQVNPMRRRDTGSQSASSVKDANFLSDLLHKSPIFRPKSGHEPTNLGYRPENGRAHLTL